MKDVFLRIQKSGSTSLLDAVEGSDLLVCQHGYSYEIGKVDGWIWDKEFPHFDANKFDNIYAVMRNPFDILISYYHHTHIGGLKNDVVGVYGDKADNMLHGWINCNLVHDFHNWQDFLESYIDPDFEWHLPPMKKSLFSFAYDEKDDLVIDDFFRLEEVGTLNKFLVSRGGSEMKIKNITQNRDRNKKYYTKKQQTKLEEIWEHDLLTFGYR